MEKSESIKNIALALVNFHKLVGKIPKDSKNPFFKSSYASLPDILNVIDTPLIDSGLVISQFPTGNHCLTTILIHADSGEYLQDSYEMKPTKDDPQGIGSCITYQRRYAIGAVLSLNIDEDDDGNKASAPAKKKEESNEPQLPWLNEKTKEWDNAILLLKGDYVVPSTGETKGMTMEQLSTKFKISKENKDKLISLLK
jgi:hypothetical protein